jgi:hypothetical protein
MTPEQQNPQEEQKRETPKPGDAYRGSDGAMTCALCDYEMDWEDCGFCGGDAEFDGYEEDPNWYAPGEMVPCSQCGGSGGDYFCGNKNCKTITCMRVIKTS